MTALPQDVKTAIIEGLRESGVDVSRLRVEVVDGDDVIIKGDVNTQEEKEAAERAAEKLARRAKMRCELEVSLVYHGDKDEVYEGSVESFPASDPPSWTPGST